MVRAPFVMTTTLKGALLAAALVFGLASGAASQEAGQFSSVTFDSVGQLPRDDDAVWALITIDMADGWKTYWRNPGDAGIPPDFDWSGSINLKSADVVWPAPKKFFDGYSHSIGYSAPRVVLPVRITPGDPTRPIVASLLLRYAVCEVICVPEAAELSGFLRSEPAEMALAETTEAALDKAPRTPADAASHVKTAVLFEDRSALTVSLAVFDGASGADLFADGPNGEPLLIPTRNDAVDAPVFTVSLDGVPEADRVAGMDVRLTIVWPEGAVEQGVMVAQAAE